MATRWQHFSPITFSQHAAYPEPIIGGSVLAKEEWRGMIHCRGAAMGQ